MTGAAGGRDSLEVDALITDRYLEALLASHARGADHGPTATPPSDAIRAVADRLVRDLPRFHPSFRFEEALASRLAEAAARMRLPEAVGAEGSLVPFAGDPAAAISDDGRPTFARPWLIGGAVTSAAISVAGALYVAWRLNRPTDGPMARAARAVARSRPV